MGAHPQLNVFSGEGCCEAVPSSHGVDDFVVFRDLRIEFVDYCNCYVESGGNRPGSVRSHLQQHCQLRVLADDFESVQKCQYLVSQTTFPVSMVESILNISVSFGDRMVRFLNSSSGIASSLPPQSRITTFLSQLASLAASTLIWVGISFCNIKMSQDSIPLTNCCGSWSKEAQAVLAPPIMMIEFSPLVSIMIMALPVGTPSLTNHCRSTLLSTISFSNSSFSWSIPTCPKKTEDPDNLAAATAWLAPLPPLADSCLSDWMVYPGVGMLLTQTKWSLLAEPRTQIFLSRNTSIEQYLLRLLLKMNQKGKRDPIPGYTGCVLRKVQQEVTENQQIQAEGQIPGYVGFISSVRAENIYGKTYGKITEECYNGQYYRGSELPPDVRFTSTAKGAFVDPQAIKNKQAQEGRINGLKTSTFYGAGRSTLNASSGSMNPNRNQKLTDLTYEQAVKRAFE